MFYCNCQEYLKAELQFTHEIGTFRDCIGYTKNNFRCTFQFNMCSEKRPFELRASGLVPDLHSSP